MKIEEMNPLILAYLGDSIYESYIRNYLVHQNLPNIKELQKKSLSYVSAKNQAKYLKFFIEHHLLNEEEETIARRARNTKGHKAPKNCDLATYKQATSLEAVIGYLYLQEKYNRIEEIMKQIWESDLC